jgi:hypothetical protein
MYERIACVELWLTGQKPAANQGSALLQKSGIKWGDIF